MPRRNRPDTMIQRCSVVCDDGTSRNGSYCTRMSSWEKGEGPCSRGCHSDRFIAVKARTAVVAVPGMEDRLVGLPGRGRPAHHPVHRADRRELRGDEQRRHRAALPQHQRQRPATWPSRAARSRDRSRPRLPTWSKNLTVENDWPNVYLRDLVTNTTTCLKRRLQDGHHGQQRLSLPDHQCRR